MLTEMWLHQTSGLLVIDARGKVRFENVVARGRRKAHEALTAGQLFGTTIGELVRTADEGRSLRALDGQWYHFARLLGKEGVGVVAAVIENGPRIPWLAGSDPALSSALSLARKFASSLLPFVIVAEAGLRVEEFAREVHESSGRNGAFWLATRCISQLTHETFASNSSQATLFFQDVDRFDHEAQNWLVSGFVHGNLAGVGITISSQRDLPTALRTGAITAPLFELLRSAAITVPPLRERSDRREVIAGAATALRCPIAPDAITALEAYPFPGNIDELEEVLYDARGRARHSASIRVEHLAERIRDIPPRAPDGSLNAAERAALEEAVRAKAGNLSAAAKQLGIARSTLYRMLERYGGAGASGR